MSNIKTKKHYNVRKKSKKNSKKNSRYSLKKRKISKLKGGANASAAVKSLCEIINEHEQSIVNKGTLLLRRDSETSYEFDPLSDIESGSGSESEGESRHGSGKSARSTRPLRQLETDFTNFRGRLSEPAQNAGPASTQIVLREPSPPPSPSTLTRTLSLSQSQTQSPPASPPAATQYDPRSAYITIVPNEPVPLVAQGRPSSLLLSNIRPGIKPDTAKFIVKSPTKAAPAHAPVSKQSDEEKIQAIEAKYKPKFKKLEEDYETINLMLNEQLEELKKSFEKINASKDAYKVKTEKTKEVNKNIENKKDEIKTNKKTYEEDKYKLQQTKAKEINAVSYIHPYKGAPAVSKKSLTVNAVKSKLGIETINSGSEWEGSESEN